MAKNLTGLGLANPTASLLSTSMLLRYLRMHSFSDRLEGAVLKVRLGGWLEVVGVVGLVGQLWLVGFGAGWIMGWQECLEGAVLKVGCGWLGSWFWLAVGWLTGATGGGRCLLLRDADGRKGGVGACTSRRQACRAGFLGLCVALVEMWTERWDLASTVAADTHPAFLRLLPPHAHTVPH